MNEREQIKERAVDAGCLDQRILKNVEHQRIDLVEWIFERIDIEPGSRILELCSGTGNQTMRMIELVGEKGFVIATDISEKSLSKLKEKADQDLRGRFTTVTAPMDDLEIALEKSGLGNHRFEIIFCAYGLYYSENPEKLLERNIKRLKENGRIVVVGPFGPNNGPLFEVLERSGVEIADYVRYTSQDFMERVVLPFACRSFTHTTIHTLVNPVRWKAPEDVMDYWRNTTFFNEQKSGAVEENIKNHFQIHEDFINEKWIMMTEMAKMKSKNWRND